MVAALHSDDMPMPHDEVKRILELLEAAYPHAPVRPATVDLYALAFADLRFEEVCDAVIDRVRASTRWPTVAELREAAKRLRGRGRRHQAEGLN
jgi:hypothetical protein